MDTTINTIIYSLGIVSVFILIIGLIKFRDPKWANISTIVALFVATLTLLYTHRESEKNTNQIQSLLNTLDTHTKIFLQEQKQVRAIQKNIEETNGVLEKQLGQMKKTQTTIIDMQEVVEKSNLILQDQLKTMDKNNRILIGQLHRADSIALSAEKIVKNTLKEAQLLSALLSQSETQIISLNSQLKTSQEILDYTKSTHLFHKNELTKRQREIIKALILEINSDSEILYSIIKINDLRGTINVEMLRTDAWDTIKNVGWITLFENSHFIDDLSSYYSFVRQIKSHLITIHTIKTSTALALSNSGDNMKQLLLTAQDLSKSAIKQTPDILIELEKYSTR